ncbi:MAG TPA: acyltransferase, partial [Puia sp.]|nr:acyltransferase [Puia sp.]
MSKDRVQILDSFRCIAVIGVMLCHFTFRYNDTPTGSLYPFGNFYGSLFKYGFMGVEFFFIISGFVISFTLENTDSFSSFCKKRFIRLFPAMLLCSVIIFLICSRLDDKALFPDAHDARNFLPSLTFTKPDLWDFTGHKFGLINWSYWSLWPEIQFYILSSVIYFSDRINFFRNLVWSSILVYLFRYIPAHFIATPGKYHHFFEAWDHL